MPRPLKVFLCHASQDKPAVRKMYFYLKQHGVQPWLDREDLLPGQDWEVEIPKAIFTSDVILVCLSANSVNKEGYVQKEIAFALDKALEKPEGTIFIIPVKLEECDVPNRLKRYQWVDYFRPDGRRRLLMGLSMRAQGLGEEITPVVMEDSKPKTSRPQAPRAEIEQENQVREEQMKEVLAEILPAFPTKQPQNKPVQRKPYTKILDPSALTSSKSRPVKKLPASKQNYRWFGIATITLLLLVFGGIGLNSLFNQPPLVTTTPTKDVAQTPKPPNETSVPITSTFESTETPIPTATLGIGSTMISEKDGMVMVYVPEGEFTMGSDDGGDDEKPEHQVYLDPYWIDQTEVTNAMYKLCVEGNRCEQPSGTYKFNNPTYSNHPVVNVDWYNAKKFCEWRSARLPTEAEWEKAARGTDGRTYPWGETVSCDYANFEDESVYCVGDTTVVGSYESGKSPFGIYDLAGNVAEWVNDWYDSIYYISSPISNPSGPTYGQYKIVRGGSWGGSISYQSKWDGNMYIIMLRADNANFMRSTFRNSDVSTLSYGSTLSYFSTQSYSDLDFSYKPSNSGNFIGFRCAMDAPQ